MKLRLYYAKRKVIFLSWPGLYLVPHLESHVKNRYSAALLYFELSLVMTTKSGLVCFAILTRNLGMPICSLPISTLHH